MKGVAETKGSGLLKFAGILLIIGGILGILLGLIALLGLAAWAGITGNDYLKDIELYAGDFFSPNIFIDEEEDYIITPAYYNDSEETILMADATANEITMSTYSSTPEDKNVSILGVKFGMTKAEVLDMFGEPTWNDEESCQWLVTVSDADMEGNLMIYFTSDADDAAVNQVTLSVRESW